MNFPQRFVVAVWRNLAVEAQKLSGRPLLWLVIDTTSKAYTYARRSHKNSQLPQEKWPQHNSLCSFVRGE